ncbi:T. brucei spp.-specific protein [Trypanosoma brucei gambiense DAL972]|uniref:T. brucei spp.-specific protein n=2 Tax=Trypanosoma brucei TaxID=5691 RepID=D0A3K2_TRYB9|nr:T. brucei spp.-specific protein [Trypanosoma brucei gambiense DAL972]RHW68584.1 hypothetical protein DPX39_100083700 [Trypanosoma brucei equiperdum]CBH15846.1 T. brucei spp.-specific protein [Trypanosoma brucei gambiense DAL972]|eukprot:XP_011778110.1 T. brucei spp.-specific protein [Trypanosoma brucei gambiense DAL972]
MYNCSSKFRGEPAASNRMNQPISSYILCAAASLQALYRHKRNSLNEGLRLFTLGRPQTIRSRNGRRPQRSPNATSPTPEEPSPLFGRHDSPSTSTCISVGPKCVPPFQRRTTAFATLEGRWTKHPSTTRAFFPFR